VLEGCPLLNRLKFLSHVIHAAKNPIDLDDRQVDAVAARIELDLRIGYAFTRMTTAAIRPLGGTLALDERGKRRVVSYGGLLLLGLKNAVVLIRCRVLPVSNSGFCRRPLF
jgi:hypothetical protein